VTPKAKEFAHVFKFASFLLNKRSKKAASGGFMQPGFVVCASGGRTSGARAAFSQRMRCFLIVATAGALLAAAPARAQSAADYPGKPVRIIVNVAPGGGVDTATRIVADKLHDRLG